MALAIHSNKFLTTEPISIAAAIVHIRLHQEAIHLVQHLVQVHQVEAAVPVHLVVVVVVAHLVRPEVAIKS